MFEDPAEGFNNRSGHRFVICVIHSVRTQTGKRSTVEIILRLIDDFRGQHHATDRRRPVGETGHAHTQDTNTDATRTDGTATRDERIDGASVDYWVCRVLRRRWTESVTPAPTSLPPVIGWLPDGGAAIPGHRYSMSAAGGRVRRAYGVFDAYLFFFYHSPSRSWSFLRSV